MATKNTTLLDFEGREVKVGDRVLLAYACKGYCGYTCPNLGIFYYVGSYRGSFRFINKEKYDSINGDISRVTDRMNLCWGFKQPGCYLYPENTFRGKLFE